MWYGNLKIQNGHYRQTYKTKPSHISLMDILVSRWLFRHLKQKIVSTVEDFIDSHIIIFLVPFLLTTEEVGVLANYSFILHRSTGLFIYL